MTAAVTIVGGGLAGMIAALELLERGCQVTIYEGSNRLGGKAGSNLVNGVYEDHGFHIFPPWYVNLWRIIDRLGFRDNFVSVPIFNQINAGEFPHFKQLDNIASPKTFFRNLESGIMPLADMFLFYYTALDLMSRSLGESNALDEISVNGFVHSRFYHNQHATLELQDLLLKAASAPVSLFSAQTLQKMLKSWMEFPDPMYSIAKGNLQEFFIQPIEKRIRELGGQIHLNTTLISLGVRDQKVTHLQIKEPGKEGFTTVDVTWLILAIQPKDIMTLLDSALFEIAPSMFSVKYLQAEPMAALNIYCKSKIEGIPREHVGLNDSKYQLSFIDVSQTWSGYSNTVLNVVSSDFIMLKSLPPNEATRAILDELRRYIPHLDHDNIERTCMQSHLEQPLFMNYVSTELYRPSSAEPFGLQNLYLAGDYCHTDVNLATMEGATESGLTAAEAIRKAIGLAQPVEIQKIKEPPRWLLVIGRIVLLPLAALAKLWTLLTHSD